MTRKAPPDPMQLRKETREWLRTHTIQDLRGIAGDLENAGEDVGELVDAIKALEEIVNESPAKTRARHAASAEA